MNDRFPNVDFRRSIILLFVDPARPVEWLSMVALVGWAWCLAVGPEILNQDSFIAFRALPAWLWAGLMFTVAAGQLLAIVSSGRTTMRFVAMACASGLWTVVAINFIASGVASTGIGTYIALAGVTALTGVWLGWAKQNSSSS